MNSSLRVNTTNEDYRKDYGGVSLDTALQYFSSEKKIEFDSLYPVYNDPDGRDVTEYEFGRVPTHADVEDFISQLPVKEMYAIYEAVCLSKEEYMHEYLWMMDWLKTSMEISEIPRSQIQARMKFLTEYVLGKCDKLDAHHDRHLAMKADKTIAQEEVHQHGMQGYRMEKRNTDATSTAQQFEASLAHDHLNGRNVHRHHQHGVHEHSGSERSAQQQLLSMNRPTASAQHDGRHAVRNYAGDDHCNMRKVRNHRVRGHSSSEPVSKQHTRSVM
ncbi:hypothetical protein PRNP1_014301 [Phytophthora ramorum]